MLDDAKIGSYKFQYEVLTYHGCLSQVLVSITTENLMLWYSVLVCINGWLR